MYKMKFVFVVLAFVLSIVAVKTQSETDSLTSSNPEDEVIKIQEKGLAILEIRILAANLPQDLLARGLDIVLNARIQFDSCKAALEVNHIIWQYKLCIITQLKVANIAPKH
ncbi:hypothetical protein Bhyg_10581 [Pseudolycoriella hygida]|uniref:Uncharacterized protein n=1 Tax=Pseudolycoriella hygida TaxID=35572 RepID=A0A9Q0MVA0_9DIPT|nr:hypothetical protein Bhyg_10581 [Pseudolycoriella hygida]